MSTDKIVIKGAREHNLKNVDVTIPRDKLIVMTGLSGSGKSSLAFDTIYADGQRRYMESLSSYARQFLGQMEKPDVDEIQGLSPAISIDQKTTSRNPRSTVGTVTEIYDYLRLLFARVGTPHCPECGREIKSQTTDQVTDDVLALGEGERALIMAPVVAGRKGEFTKLFQDLQKEGFSRVRIDGEVTKLGGEPVVLNKKIKHFIDVVVDRVVLKESARARIAQAVEMACQLADGRVLVKVMRKGEEAANVVTSSGATGGLAQGEHLFSLALACPEHGYSMTELQPRDFSFNAPYGACPDCLGIGSREEVDPSLMVPDKSLSLSEGAVAPFRTGNYYPQVMRAVLEHYNVSPDTPWEDIPRKVQKIMMEGAPDEKIRVDYVTVDGRETYWFIEWEGICEAVMHRYKEASSDRQRQKYEQYFSIIPCATCGGKRLNPQILAVTVAGKNIHEVCEMSSRDSLAFFEGLDFSDAQAVIAVPIVKEIKTRLRFLVDVGLDYLTLERATATLSGGEAQRIRLATQIGAGLMGVLYILDEPSIGLHQRDNDMLLDTLKRLRDLGNTLIVVEHDEDTMRAADYIVDIGPAAGVHGGQVIAAGTAEEIMAVPASITGQYLSGAKKIPVPSRRRTGNGHSLTIRGAAENNLDHVDVTFPLGTFTCVTGVSGSGKSSLVNEILFKRLGADLNRMKVRPGKHTALEGEEFLDKVIDIDQSPIGRTPRSNPATYTGLFGDIRELFASTPDAKSRGYGPGRFSFNVKGGRCESCAGDGLLKIEMHFLPDIYVPCEVCKGKRYNRETLEVKYKGKNIHDVLDMTVDEGLAFFANLPKLRRKLETLSSVGLGYLKIGQSSTTLSGGEAQRVKLATELARRSTGKTIYILDEPTTGLHTYDVHKLLEVLDRLVEGGNTVVVIEHNLDVIKWADHVIDLGPEGGSGGGHVVCTGTPEEVAQCEASYTGRYLKKLLK